MKNFFNHEPTRTNTNKKEFLNNKFVMVSVVCGKIIRLFLLSVFSLLLPNCSQISSKLLIMEANFHHSRGLYTEAIASYQKAKEYPEAAPYSEFGLGAVYFTLGEEKAALNRFAEAQNLLEASSPGANRELHYRIHYNTGVVLFSEGDFSGAVDAFRSALKADGSKKEAKRNLELSILSLAQGNTPDGSGDGEDGNESRAALFEYVQQKEFNQWKSREWEKEKNIDEPDY